MKARYRYDTKYDVYCKGQIIDSDTFGSYMKKGEVVIVAGKWYIIESIDLELKQVIVSQPIDADAAELSFNKKVLTKLNNIKTKKITLDAYIAEIDKKIKSYTPPII